jgi:hypothetical protein
MDKIYSDKNFKQYNEYLEALINEKIFNEGLVIRNEEDVKDIVRTNP